MEKKRYRAIMAAVLGSAALVLGVIIGLGAAEKPSVVVDPDSFGMLSGRSVVQITLATSQAITTTNSTLGNEISIDPYDKLLLWIDYDNNGETAGVVTPYFLYSSAGEQYQQRGWGTTAGIRSLSTADSYSMTADSVVYLSIDSLGWSYVQFKVQGTGSFTTGNAGKISATLSLIRSN